MKYLLIGDCHGQVDYLDKIYSECNKVGLKTIQIGDMGFRETYQYLNKNQHSATHKFIPGNHEYYDSLPKHALGDYGMYNEVFFVRGGFSIDHMRRTIGESWFPQEELSRQERADCLDLYKKLKPDIVLSHEAPLSIVHNFTDPGFLVNWGYNPKTFETKTQNLLQEMFEFHRPKFWAFGHYHRKWEGTINGTYFRLLNILEPYLLDTDLWTSSSTSPG